MSIKTYEIHNSYLQDAPDNAGITRMVSEADYLSQLQQTDALQTSLNNIINAFGISGEGAHSKLVIEYVHGLVAENAALRRIALSYHILTVPEREAPTEPEIDAAVAEIKAQGVALAISHLSKKFTNLGVPITSLEWLEVELRAGRKG